MERHRLGSSAKRKTKSQAEVEAKFSGEQLRLARNFHGLTLVDLGARVAADPGFLSRIETGKQEPGTSLLTALAEELGFSEQFFFTDIADPFSLEECHFRHLQRATKRLKEVVLAEGTLVGELVGRLAEALDLPRFNVPEIMAASEDEIEEAARRCRVHWGLGENSRISNMVRLAENAGIVVVRLSENSRDVDAFSRFGRVSVIVLNDDKKSATRSRFDVGHELGHLVMHRGKETGDPITEGQANRFASALLLPRDEFTRTFRQMPGLSWAHLFEMKRQWKVSVAAIVRRGYDLGLLSEAEYRRAYKYLHFKGWHLGEPQEPPLEAPELLGLALDAYGEEAVDLRDLAAALHWKGTVMERIAGRPLPPLPQPGNVTNIESRLRRA